MLLNPSPTRRENRPGAPGVALLLGVLVLLAGACGEEVPEPSEATAAASPASADRTPAPTRTTTAPSQQWERFPVQPYAAHVSPGDPHPPYNSTPATSGWHYGVVTRWGVYPDAVIPDEVLVHNLEHGGIGIHFNCPEGCPELVEDLAEIAGRYDKVVVSPYPDMEARIALTAWTYLARLDAFDEERIVGFIEAHMGSSSAPEGSLPP